jgi:hypothetical protein
VDAARYKQLKKRILDVNVVVSTLDPAIRAQAFALMKPYLSSQPNGGDSEEKAKLAEQEREAAPLDAAALTAPTDGTPAENIVLIAAHLYSKYGTEPFTVAEVKKLGDDFGLTVPNRVANSLKTAKHCGKKLFQKVGKHFRPTVHGEATFRSEYRVTGGR